MPVYEFAKDWIDKNVNNLVYPNMPDHVLELVNVILKQRHSGASVRIVMMCFVNLMEAYLYGEDGRTPKCPICQQRHSWKHK